LERGDERPRRGEIVEVSRRCVRHADMIREGDPPYKPPTRSRDPFIPPAAARLRHVDA
jgi:hypothetical protein